MQAGAGRWAARRVRAGRAGRAQQASVSGRGAQGARGVQASERAGRAGERARGHGRTRRRQARRGALSASGQAAARAAGAGMGARGAGRGRAERAAWACGARGLGVPVCAGWACWLVSWASFGAQCTWLSFDSVFGPIRLGIFLSHLMNTVHCKINFRKKKFIKFN